MRFSFLPTRSSGSAVSDTSAERGAAWGLQTVVRDNLGGPEVGKVVLPARPGGSPAAREWQVNVPLTLNNDLPYGFFGARGFCPGPRSRNARR